MSKQTHFSLDKVRTTKKVKKYSHHSFFFEVTGYTVMIQLNDADSGQKLVSSYSQISIELTTALETEPLKASPRRQQSKEAQVSGINSGYFLSLTSFLTDIR